MIEDTSFIIDVLRGDSGALEKLNALENDRVPEKIASITVLESYEGLIRSDQSSSSQETEKVMDVLTSKHILEAGTEVMMQAGRISGELYREGSPIDRENCIIAASAIREDEPVLTRNTDHFRRVSGLDVVSY